MDYTCQSCGKPQNDIWIRQGYFYSTQGEHDPSIGWIEFTCPECEAELDTAQLEKLRVI